MHFTFKFNKAYNDRKQTNTASEKLIKSTVKKLASDFSIINELSIITVNQSHQLLTIVKRANIIFNKDPLLLDLKSYLFQQPS